MKRIAVIGPVPPYRGGIAHHTGLLACALRTLADVRVFSFSRLYPAWLYPGKFQTEAALPAVGNGNARFTLDSLNPITWRHTARAVHAFRPDAVLVPWWTFFLAPCFRYLCAYFRRHSIPVIMLCHNVVDHEAVGWKRRVSKWCLRNADMFVVQTHEEAGKLLNLLGDVNVLYHPHPIYDRFPMARRTLVRRARLELLFYGFIRPYKGLDVLIDAMSQIRGEDVYLSIVGEPWGKEEDVWRERIAKAALDGMIEFVPRYVSDEETAEYFARADAVVLPYRAATGTGVVATAYHYGKPVIASCVGGLKDVVEDQRTGVLVTPEDPESLAQAIRGFHDGMRGNVGENIRAFTHAMSWEHMASTILAGVTRREASE